LLDRRDERFVGAAAELGFSPAVWLGHALLAVEEHRAPERVAGVALVEAGVCSATIGMVSCRTKSLKNFSTPKRLRRCWLRLNRRVSTSRS
jgi:hypothetical protein